MIRATEYAHKNGIPVVHDSYTALINDPKVDAVYIGLQNSGHAEWAIRAMKAGKHVLCEKPLACNQFECAAISATANSAHGGRLVCMEAFHYRYHPLMKRVQQIIASGEIGPIVVHVYAAFCIFIRKLTDIRLNFALGGGSLMDTGPYALNAIRTCLFTPIVGSDAHAVTPLVEAVNKKRAAAASDEKAAAATAALNEQRAKCLSDEMSAGSFSLSPPAAAALTASQPSVYDEPEMDVQSASAKLCWQNVDQSMKVELKSADFLLDKSATLECSLRTLIPKIPLVVTGYVFRML